MKKLIVFSFLILFCCSTANSATYYIDWDSGNDSNNGTSKETPWKRAPGMYGCFITDTNDNNCRARTHSTTSGDFFIFKGGVTWPADAMGMHWYFGNNTYFGVDATWYDATKCSAAGYSGWCRPIFDANGTEPHSSPESFHSMLAVWGEGTTIDNIEFKGIAQFHGTDTSASGCNGEAGNGYGLSIIALNYGGPPLKATVKNNYIHGWSHGEIVAGDSCTCWGVTHPSCNRWVSGVDAGKVVGDNTSFVSFYVDSSPDYYSQFFNNIIDGSDTTGDIGWNTVAGGWGHVYNNYFSYVQNVTIAVDAGYFWGNTYYEIASTIADMDVSQHHQVFENYGQTLFWNNYIYKSGGGATLIIYGEEDKNDFVFNNVIIEGNDQIIQASSDAQATYIFNNTLQTIAGISLYAVAQDGYSLVRNNHIMTDGGFIKQTENGVFSNNITTTPAAASSNFTSDVYPYFPISESSPSVDAGADLSSYCDLLTDNPPSYPKTDCLKDATLGVIYNTGTRTLSYPKRASVARTIRDIGAYEYTSGEGTTLKGVSTGSGALNMR